MSSEMACRAASLICSGAAKSGKPWERLTALCCMARRVISRMTDSVNCSALAESILRAIWDMLVSGVDMGLDCSKVGKAVGSLLYFPSRNLHVSALSCLFTLTTTIEMGKKMRSGHLQVREETGKETSGSGR